MTSKEIEEEFGAVDFYGKYREPPASRILIKRRKAGEPDVVLNVPSCLPAEGVPPTYVSEFFAKNQHQKPAVRVGKVGLHPFGTLKHKIDEDLVDVEDAKAFIYWALKEHTSKLHENWTSYQVEIGKEGEHIGIGNIVGVTVDENAPEVLGTSGSAPATQTEILWGLMMMLSPFRLSAQMREDYRAILVARFKTLIAEYKIPTGGKFLWETFFKNRIHWTHDPGYGRLVSALDMYFMRFPDDKWAKLRVCTIGARYKNCAALTSFEFIRRRIGYTMDDMIFWVWTSEIAKEVEGIFFGDEEMGIMHSYLPYIAGMFLAQKSPYSASVCPNLHTWVHIAGSILGYARSLKAKHLDEGNIINAFFNAHVLAYANYSRAEWKRQFQYKDEDSVEDPSVEGVEQTNVPADASGAGEPEDNDPRKWWAYISQFGYVVPSHILKANAYKARTIPCPRPETLGNYVRDWAKGVQL